MHKVAEHFSYNIDPGAAFNSPFPTINFNSARGRRKPELEPVNHQNELQYDLNNSLEAIESQPQYEFTFCSLFKFKHYRSEDHKNRHAHRDSQSQRNVHEDDTPQFDKPGRTGRSEHEVGLENDPYEDEQNRYDSTFNPKSTPTKYLALVPYVSLINQYLQSMVADSPESELSYEMIEKAEYNQVRKIIEGGGYNFDNPPDTQSILKPPKFRTPDENMVSQYLPSAQNTATNFNGLSIDLNHNVENYIMYKQIKQKEKYHNTNNLATVKEGMF